MEWSEVQEALMAGEVMGEDGKPLPPQHLKEFIDGLIVDDIVTKLNELIERDRGKAFVFNHETGQTFNLRQVCRNGDAVQLMFDPVLDVE
ncbi:MAG: hypothetical protein KC964_19780 [Candidatus Omnitrophica bacterium]|nr:hypothetical protein [Candidatus Omnitrophota bacterium]